MPSPTVFKRAGRRNYYVSIQDRVVSTGMSDQYTAQQVAREMKEIGIEAYRQGKRALGDHLYDLIESHLTHLKEIDGRDRKHLQKKRMQLMMPVDEGVFTKLKDVNKRNFEPWWNGLTCGPKTSNEYMTAWNVFLDWLVYEEKLSENPIRGKVRRAKVTKQDKEPRRAFTQQELKSFFSVAGQHETLYLIAYVTGARWKELKQLLWTDVHETGSVPCIKLRPETTKNGNGRTQYLTIEAAEMLKHTRALSRTDRVFPRMPSRHTVNKHIKLAGIPKLTNEGRACFHSLRHSFTTTVARMTKDARLAQRMADHADITTTQGYLHTEQSEHAAEMREFPTVREGSERAVKRAVVDGETGQIVSNEVPAKSNENGTQVSASASLSAVESHLVQGRELMEPGGIEWSTSSLFSGENGVIYRARSAWRSARALGANRCEIGKIAAADLPELFAHRPRVGPCLRSRGEGWGAVGSDQLWPYRRNIQII